MKRILRLCCILLLCSWNLRSQTILVEASNPLPVERNSETLVIRTAELEHLLPNASAERLVVRDAATREELLSQVTEGEFLFQSHFGPNEKKEFLIAEAPTRTNPASLVDGRFVLPREDYAWENDRIAFRMYGPALAAEVNNGIDVWTKRVRYLIVEKWYASSRESGKDTYHEDHGEGADFFTVGRTLGAGGSGIWFNGKLYQPGVFSSQRTIARGPVRVVFELAYDRWNVEGKMFKEVKRISLDAGQNVNKIEVTFTGLSRADTLTVACGLARRKNAIYERNDKACWMSLWGQTNEDPVNGYLGTGVVLGAQQCIGFVEDTIHYMMLGKALAGEKFTYYAGAGWTRSGDFASAEDWKGYLDQVAARLQHPVAVVLRIKQDK